MSLHPARKVSNGGRPFLTGPVKNEIAQPHRLATTNRAALLTRLDTIRDLPEDALPERLFCSEVLMFNFEIDRSGKTLRELLSTRYIEGSSFVSIEHLDRLKEKLAQMTPARAKTINYPLLRRINEAVRQEAGPVDLSAGGGNNRFTPVQYRQRVRALSAMIGSMDGHQIEGQMFPLRILLKRRNGHRTFDPVAALRDLSAELAQPTEQSEYIMLDDKYLALFRDQLSTIKEQYGPFGFDRLKTINQIVQGQYRAYQEQLRARQEKRLK